MNSKIGRLAAVLFAGWMSIAATAPAQEEHHASDPSHAWSYSGATGPEHWGDLSPEFAACKDGKRQSPIDIVHPQMVQLPAIHVASHPVPLHLVNNGHTIMQAYPHDSGNTMMVDGQEYELQQFHFHLPSEEAIDGMHYEMVAHLVYANKQGQLAVIGVLVKKGKANPVISTLWSHLPQSAGQESQSDAVVVNLVHLLPAKRTYYTYPGSLTTPPCTEGVTFYILDTPMEFSEAQIAKFAAIYPDNARPVQPLNGRTVQHSK